ncbi:MAG: hypothetical protein Ct9H300mP28_29920 [Pseudomonadota bacterium]|nr:MAG: hypothetical protein Ct9H300mP28_29920 [Pseudomonadota bacterium]
MRVGNILLITALISGGLAGFWLVTVKSQD